MFHAYDPVRVCVYVYVCVCTRAAPHFPRESYANEHYQEIDLAALPLQSLFPIAPGANSICPLNVRSYSSVPNRRGPPRSFFFPADIGALGPSAAGSLDFIGIEPTGRPRIVPVQLYLERSRCDGRTILRLTSVCGNGHAERPRRGFAILNLFGRIISDRCVHVRCYFYYLSGTLGRV